MKKQLRQYISEGKTDKAIKLLLELIRCLDDEHLTKDIILLSSKHKQYSSDKYRGLTSQTEQAAFFAQINEALMDIISRLPDDRRRLFVLFLYRRKWWEWVIAIGIFVGCIFVVDQILGGNLASLRLGSITESNSLTILVHGPRGKDEKVLPGRGVVKLLYGDAIVSKQINSDGEATFKQISHAFFHEDARVEILFEDPLGEPYQALHPDSLYRLERGKYIGLVVKLHGLEKISGIVKDFVSGKPIAGTKVRVQGEEAISNTYGEFTLILPEKKQRQFQTIRAYHPAYQDFELSDVPTQTQREISIMMKPK